MAMNKRGQTIFYLFMIGVVVILLAINLAFPLNQVTQSAMASTNTSAGIETGLNCSTVTSYQDKANCVAVDMFNPLIIGTLLGIAGLILARSFL